MSAPERAASEPSAMAFDAIVLAGGLGSRLGGVDKPALLLDGSTLGARAVAAVDLARAIALVGDTSAAVAHPRLRRTSEEPRRAGPVAAVAAGLDVLGDEPERVTVLLAADLVDPGPAVARLLAASSGAHDAVIAVDPAGRRQPLLAAYRTDALRAAVDGVASGHAAGRGPSMRAVLDRLSLLELPQPAAWCADVDTPGDAERHGIRLPDSEVRRASAA